MVSLLGKTRLVSSYSFSCASGLLARLYSAHMVADEVCKRTFIRCLVTYKTRNRIISIHSIRFHKLFYVRKVYRFSGADKHVYNGGQSLVFSEGFLVHHVFYKRGLFSLFDRILLELNGFLNEKNKIIV